MTTQPTAREKYAPPTETQLADAYALVERFATMWAKPNLVDMERLMHVDTRNLIPPMTQPADRAGVLAHFSEVLRQLPDLWIEVIRWAPTGDTVMIEWRAHASVAGHALSWTGVDRFGIRGERMYEAHVYWDTRQVAANFAAAVQAAGGR
ncbi:MAG: nuclear transport factor 2 family protein [Burkholderiaceae bacterium]|nr:nuclear transport factor 2 family protein [Burkholderiaceae bacterium]